MAKESCSHLRKEHLYSTVIPREKCLVLNLTLVRSCNFFGDSREVFGDDFVNHYALWRNSRTRAAMWAFGKVNEMIHYYPLLRFRQVWPVGSFQKPLLPCFVPPPHTS